MADIHLTVLHRNFLGVDEFLGQASLPLSDFDVYERPKSRALPLKCKPGKNKNQYRGEIEARGNVFDSISKIFFVKVKVGFTVKATANLGGSAVDLSKKNKGSISSLNKVKFPPTVTFKSILSIFLDFRQHQRFFDEFRAER